MKYRSILVALFLLCLLSIGLLVSCEEESPSAKETEASTAYETERVTEPSAGATTEASGKPSEETSAETSADTSDESSTESSTEPSEPPSTDTSDETDQLPSEKPEEDPSEDTEKDPPEESDKDETVPDPPHTHVFDCQVTTEAYLYAPATCLSPAWYHYSCACGEAGADFFENGENDPENHEDQPHWAQYNEFHLQIYFCCYVHATEQEEHLWNEGTCSVCLYSCSHIGGEATCMQLASCSACGEEYGELAPHIGGEATCMQLASCSVCGEEYGELAPHDFSILDECVEPGCETAGSITYSCVCGVSNTEELSATGHDYREWSTYTAPTCQSEGEAIRGCYFCGRIERQVLEALSHAYTKVLSTEDDNGNDCVSLICEMCEGAAGSVYNGVFLASHESMYLYSCAPAFSFDVYCEKDLTYVQSNLRVVDFYWQDVDVNQHPEVLIPLTVTSIGEHLYRVSPTASYEENNTYYTVLGEGISFTDKPGSHLVFRIEGEELCSIEYNDNIRFLKAIAEEKQLTYEYLLEFDEEQMLYGLALPASYGLDATYVGSLLCIGDCVNFTEADALDPDTVVIGKIESVELADDGILLLVLSIPSVEEIYSGLQVSGGSLPGLDETIVSEETKAAAVENLAKSDAFLSAVAAANVAATNYAASVGLQAAVNTSVDPADIEITVTVEVTGPHTVLVVMKMTYEHPIQLMDGDISLGTVTVTIEFESSCTFDIYVNSNLDQLFSGELKKGGLSLDCTVTNTILNTFDLSVDLQMAYTYRGEMTYVVNQNTGTIHLSSCRFCPALLDERFAAVSYQELLATYDDPSAHECGVCKPLSMSDAGFALNTESGMLHCINCMYVKDITADHIIVYKTYPLGETVENCSACQPHTHTKTLEQYLEESVSDANFDEMFTMMKENMDGFLQGGGSSPIGDDTKPRITIPLYCFEIPIYVEPNIDFNLKAHFQLHYELSIKNSVFVALIYDNGSYRVIGDCSIGLPEEQVTIDMTGELHIEIGVITEVRLGVRYVSKYVYVGILGQAGMYIDAKGVYHLDTATDEQYYAARLEIGYYTEVRCTYRVIGIVEADSFDILEKNYTPLFNSGDDKIYYRFESCEETLRFNNTKRYLPGNQLLRAYYYDLTAMETKLGNLRWSESTQYGFLCTFTDENGAVVDYIIFENGAIKVLDNAPAEFTVYMTVQVYDKIQYDTFAEYFGKNNRGGCAIFLTEKVIEIQYSYEDTTDQMDEILGTYAGKYAIGTDLFGQMRYRNQILGIYKTEELYENIELLELYATLLTYVETDENGNPVTIYMVEDLQQILRGLQSDYVVISYTKPHEADDIAYSMSISAAYYDGGPITNGESAYSVEVENAGYVYLSDMEFTPGVGFSGSVYADENHEEYIGTVELLLTELV